MTISFLDLLNTCERVGQRLNEPRLMVSHLAGVIKIGLYTSPIAWDGQRETLPPDTWKTLFVAKDYDEAARWLAALTPDMIDLAQPRKTFTMRLRRLLPGSVTATGGVVDYRGVTHCEGPCWVPHDFGASLRNTMARCRALDDAGWRVIGARHPKYPSIPPTRGVMCVIQATRGI